jgi:hypothetical protein
VHQHGPPAAVHHDTTGRAVVVFVAEILPVPGTVTTPTNTRSSRRKINTSSATGLTLTDPITGGRNDDQQKCRSSSLA